MSNVQSVTESDWDEQVLRSDVPVLVDLWAPWCGPCRMVAPVVEQIAGETAGRLKVTKLNIDEFPSIPSQLGVMNIPTLLLFKGGEEVTRVVGFRNKPQLLKLIAEHVEGVGSPR